MSGLDDLAGLLAGLRRTTPTSPWRVGTVIGPADDSGYIEVDMGGGETRIIAGDADEGDTIEVEVVGNQARRSAANLVDVRQPAAPTGLTVTPTLYLTRTRRWAVRLVFAWDPVTTATDGTDLEIDSYSVWGTLDGEPSAQEVGRAAAAPSLTIDGWTPGQSWIFTVQAHGVTTTDPGQHSAPVAITLPSDTTPPPKPSPPLLDSSAGILTAVWDGLDADGDPMPEDLRHVRVRAGTANPPTAVVGTMATAGAWSGISTPGATIYVQLVAVDFDGNVSEPSEVVATTIHSVLDDADLAALLALDATVYVQDEEPVSPPAGSWWWTRTSQPVTLRYTDDGITWAVVPLDGSEYIGAPVMVAGQMIARWIQSENLASDSILARHIRVGEVTADKVGTGLLAARITLSGLIQTAESGSRVVMDSGGITLYDADGGVVIAINTDGTSSFYGKATLTELEVTGVMSLTKPGNTIAPGASLVLEAGIQAPPTSPTITNVWPSVVLKDSAGVSLTDVRSVGRMTDGEIVAFTHGNRRLSVHDAAGTWIRDTIVTRPGGLELPDLISDMVVVNNHAVIASHAGGLDYDAYYELIAVNLSTWHTTSYFGGATSQWKFGSDSAVIWDDGTRLIIQDKGAGGNFFVHTFTWSGDNFTTTVGTKSLTALKDASRPFARSSFDLGVDTILASDGGKILAWNYNPVAQNANGHFYVPSTADITGIGYHAGVIWVANGATVHTLDGPTWNNSGPTKNVEGGYTYRHNSNGFESKLSKVATFAHRKRARIRFAAPGWIPTAGITHLRYYAAYAGATKYAQGDTASGALTASALIASGSTPPATSSFPASTPGKISSAQDEWWLRGDGTYKLPAMAGAKMAKTANQTFSAWTWTKIAWDAVEHETATGIADLVAEQLLVPADGLYLIGLQVSHPTNYGSTQYREAAIALGTAATNFIARVGSYNPATTGSPSGQGAIFQPVTTIRRLTAGNILTAWYRSTVGSNFGTLTATDPFNFWLQKIGD